MGRKIPAKKHRGVKDPLQQQAKRDQKLKSKINAPPSDPDAQPVPRSLTELFSRPVRTPTKKLKRKLALVPAAATMGKSNPISRLRKLPGESGRGFTMRINSAIRALHDSDEAQEYPQDLEEEDARGSRIAALRERRQRRRGRPPPPARDSRKDRVKLKKAAAAQAALAAQRERPQYERVPFGAVSAAPPALPAPRGAPHSAPRSSTTLMHVLVCMLNGAGSRGAASCC
ncbi:uncharacterized protein LOC128673824 isoform X2 [Plodia interpunctella]|uniref:uncharacterized protein LOC128673824 isoform X2 n=1 Tax=Plodia interpunctella TaxID=58824 RepID=UPI002368387C|nr:uncharacterized protein LOC128673824 isoform X2 [Plodia interpunctella]